MCNQMFQQLLRPYLVQTLLKYELYCDYFIMFKGFAVRTTDTFNVGDFLLEYRGTVEPFDCTTEQARIPHTYLFRFRRDTYW